MKKEIPIRIYEKKDTDSERLNHYRYEGVFLDANKKEIVKPVERTEIFKMRYFLYGDVSFKGVKIFFKTKKEAEKWIKSKTYFPMVIHRLYQKKR